MADSETASLLGSIAIALGAVGGGITLLDWALPKRAKEVLNDKVADFWLWLSYQRTWPYIRALRSRRAFNIHLLTTGAALPAFILLLTIVYAADPTLLGLHSRNDDPRAIGLPTSYIWMLAGTGTVIWAVPALIYYTMRRALLAGYLWATAIPNVWNYLGRFFLLYFLASVAILPFFGLWGLLADHLLGQAAVSSTQSIYLPYMTLIIGWVIMMIIWMTTMGYGLLLLYIVAIFPMIALLIVLKYVVLRLLEFDKGPLLGISAALTALGTVIKAFA